MSHPIETAPDFEPIDVSDFLPGDLKTDEKLKDALIGELLYAHCPDGYAMPISRMQALASGCGHKWEVVESGGAYRAKLVNGS